MGLSITANQLAQVQALHSQGKVGEAWQLLSSFGDNYATAAFDVVAQPLSFYGQTVRNTWDVVGAHFSKFGAVSRKATRRKLLQEPTMCKQLAISPEYYLAALSVVAIAPLLTPQGQDFFHKLERAEIGIISLGILLIAIQFLCLAIQQTRVGVLIVFVYGLLFVFPYLTVVALAGLAYMLLRSDAARNLRLTICGILIITSAAIAGAIRAAG